MRQIHQLPTSLFRAFALFLLLLGAVAAAHAQGGPPLLTDDPGTPGNKHWEINIAYTEARFEYGNYYELPHLDLNYGYGNNVQLKLEGPYSIYNAPGNDFSSFGFAEAGVKWRFQEDSKTRPALSIYPQWTVLGNLELGGLGPLDPGMDFLMPMEVMKSFGAFQLDGELGILFRQFSSTQFSAGVCAEYDITKRLALLGEVHDYANLDFTDHEPLWNLGFKYDLSERESILFSAGRGFGVSGSDSTGFQLYAGVQLRI